METKKINLNEREREIIRVCLNKILTTNWFKDESVNNEIENLLNKFWELDE